MDRVLSATLLSGPGPGRETNNERISSAMTYHPYLATFTAGSVAYPRALATRFPLLCPSHYTGPSQDSGPQT